MSSQTKKKPTTQNPSHKEENLQQEKLQALILLDSYSNKYEPLSSSKPECLLPLIGGKTLLDNNIEYLIQNNVEEIYLFCTRHHQQIRNHIEQRKWRRFVEIHFFYNLTCRSFGDAMREIDAKGLIRTNFILLTATSVISNIKLKYHLELHRQVSKTDKNVVMTIMCINRQTDLAHSNKANNSNETNNVIVHNINKRILHYEQLTSAQAKQKNAKLLQLPSNLLEKAYGSAKQSVNLTQQAVDNANAKFKLQQLQQNQFNLNALSGYQGGSEDTVLHLKTIQHRNDLIESQIYFCSPYFLHMFTDNFDYETMKDFVNGVLADEEVSGYTIYIDEFKFKHGSHFGLINNLNSYYYETMRLLQRADLVLDFDSRAYYRRLLDSINVYLSKNLIKIGDNSRLNRNVFVDSGSKIGENCQLTNCFIGSECIIGNNVKLSNTIIWPKSQIGNNSVLNACLIGFNVKIGNNCSLIENTLLSNNCKLKDNTNLKERGVYYAKEQQEKKDKKTSVSSESDFHETVTDESCDEKEAHGSFKLDELSKQLEGVSLEVNEDNYYKYFLSHKNSMETEEEDEFGSEQEEEGYEDDEEDDVQSNVTSGSDGKNLVNDTSKNQHFYVWKLRTRKDSKSAKKLLRSGEYELDYEVSFDSSDYSVSSSDEDDFDKNDSEEEVEDTCDTSEPKSTVVVSQSHDQEETELFFKEVISVLKRALKENQDPTNVILETNSRKHANGIQIDELCYFFAKAVLNLPIILSGLDTSKTLAEQQQLGQNLDYLKSIKTYIEKLSPVLQNYYTKTKQSQRIFLNSIQDFFIETKLHSDQSETGFLDSNYVKTIHFIYNDCELLNEDLVIEWYDKQTQLLEASKKPDQQLNDLDLQAKILAQKIEIKRHSINKLKPFIDWLKEDDEDEDEDDDDE